jgi:RAD51-like protein 2
MTTMTDMSLSHLPLRPSSLELLQRAGYVATTEFITAKERGGIATLAAELQVSSHMALSIFHEVLEALNRNGNNGNNQNNGNSNSSNMMTAKSILDQRQQQQSGPHISSNGHILTFCRELDQILGGGIPLGQVSEIVGPPGSGKTLLATQLAVNVTLPPVFGGVDGRTIYIDTEGSFAPERCYTLADHLIRHIRVGVEKRRKLEQQQQQQQHHQHHDQQQWQVTPEDILARVTVYRAHSVADLVAVLDVLEGNDNDDENPLALRNCRLIVIDSIAFPFRSIPPDVARTRLLASVAARLTQWATMYDLAVVCINQRTTDTTRGSLAGPNGIGGGGGTAALGATWGHAVANRLSVSLSSSVANNNDANTTTPFASSSFSTKREAILVKSARMPVATAEFQVTEAGIRGLDYVVHTSSSSSASSSLSSHHHYRKKPKFGR